MLQKSPLARGQKAANNPEGTGQKVWEFARFGRFCLFFASESRFWKRTGGKLQ
jgi:hypothetical protein